MFYNQDKRLLQPYLSVSLQKQMPLELNCANGPASPRARATVFDPTLLPYSMFGSEGQIPSSHRNTKAPFQWLYPPPACFSDMSVQSAFWSRASHPSMRALSHNRVELLLLHKTGRKESIGGHPCLCWTWKRGAVVVVVCFDIEAEQKVEGCAANPPD